MSKKRPEPISLSTTRKPPKKKEAAPAPEQAPQGINDISPITAKQIQRAERAIDNLREDVRALSKKQVTVKSEAPKVDVIIPPRARISKVTIKYDQLGYPAELIPQYSEPAV